MDVSKTTGHVKSKKGQFVPPVKIKLKSDKKSNKNLPIIPISPVIKLINRKFVEYTLMKVDLSFAYPFVALSYVIIIITAWLFLGENISLLRLVGVLVICLGVFLISRS